MLRSTLNRGAGLLALASLCLSLGAGCTFDDGQPWGKAQLSLAVEAQPRLDAQGRWLTSKDYAVEVESMTMRFGTLQLQMAGAAGVATFDPADPPAGYSLCHNGHCHADDGRLVDYEDIAVELAQAQGQGAPGVVAALDKVWSLGEQRALTPSACADDCELPLGTLSTLSLSITALNMKLRVFDTRQQPRLPQDGLSVELNLSAPMSVTALLAGDVGKDDEPGVILDSALVISGKLFDESDFEALLSAQAAPDAPVDASAVESFVAPFTARFLETSLLVPGLSRAPLK